LQTNKVPCYEKTKFSMLTDPVRQTLAQHNAKTVYLVGLETHVCVLQTTLELLQDGFRVYLVTDCVSSQHEIDRTTAIQRMHRAGAILITAESAVYNLMKDANHPKFKEILPFTKQYAAFKNERKRSASTSIKSNL